MNNDINANAAKFLAQAKNFLTDVWKDIIAFFNSYQWQEIVFVLKIVLIILSILMLIGIIIVWIKKLRL